MFNKYWRYYPWHLQLLLFLMLYFILASFFGLAIFPLLQWLTGVNARDIETLSSSSSDRIIHAALLLQLLSSAFIFLVPAYLAAYFTHPHPATYLGLHKVKQPLHWLLAVALLLAAIPLLFTVAKWMGIIDFGDWGKKLQEENKRVTEAFLKTTGSMDLAFSLVVMAVAPAICEEIFFRGFIMRLATKLSKRIPLGILFSALLFALIHFNPEGFLSIFIAGCLLGFLYYITGSLWPGILAHTCYNGLQVVLEFMANKNEKMKDLLEHNSVSWPLFIGGTLLFAFILYLLWKKQTPLPQNWAADFTTEEIELGRNTNNPS